MKVNSKLCFYFLVVGTFLSFAANSVVFAGQNCSILFNETHNSGRFSKIRPETKIYPFSFPGLKISSLSDSSLSTGLTLFTFPPGSTAQFDARGGSVASVETSLLEEGSYSNEVDAIVFAGGSTMGLEATQGVRRKIFNERRQDAGAFDLIPGVPGAVVYDYGGRIEKNQKKLKFPDMKMGAAAYDQAREGVFLLGRAGAGTTTTANKISEQAIWGGQGAHLIEVQIDDSTKIKVLVAVVLNPHGNIHLSNGNRLVGNQIADLSRDNQDLRGTKRNTTLSIVITDAALDRNQLKRLATTVHTSMAQHIRPFHSYSDGDILFSVSTQQVAITKEIAMSVEELLQDATAGAMSAAILKAVSVSNQIDLRDLQ